MATQVQVTFDCADPAGLGRFWASVLGYIEQPPPPGYDTWDAALDDMGVPADERDTMYAVVDPDGIGPRLLFQKVPEGKTAKNRMHLDVNAGGPPGTPHEERKKRAEAKAAELGGIGGKELRREEIRGEFWIVMQDPEGNEFCLQ